MAEASKNKIPRAVFATLAVFALAMSAIFWFDWCIYYDKLLPSSVTRVIPAPAQWLENIIYDITVARIGGSEPDKRISIAAIDDETINALGWPFPRKYHAELIRRLNDLGAKTIVFDVMFLDPDQRDASSDRDLLAETKKAGNIIHAGLVASEVTARGVVYSFKYPFGNLGALSYILANPNVDDVVDRDGHIRRVMLFYPRAYYTSPAGTGCKNCDGLKIASLSAAGYAHFSGTPVEEVYTRFKDNNIRWINYTIPTTYLKNYVREEGEHEKFIYAAYPHISILDILGGTLSQEQKAMIKGGIVFIGATSLGTFDHYPTPFQMTAPGVELHANSLDNLINNNYMRDVNPLIPFAAMLFFIALPVITFRSSPYLGAAVAAAAFFIWTVQYVWLNIIGVKTLFVLPVGGLAASFVFVTLYRVIVEGREKRWIKNTFGQYLSPKVVDVIVKDPAKLKLGGDKRDMTVFFLDIAHFTSISEKMDPEQLTQFLNKYLSELTNIILKNEGVVDKYIGDCIMAFWNAPLDLPKHRTMGALSAVECIAALNRLNAQLAKGDMPEMPAIRIGVNAGNMVVGNMGSNMRFSYTVIGDEVNLASRMEGANKYFGSRIMASESVYEESKDLILSRELGRIRVVGKAVPIRVYELLAKRSEASEQDKLLAEAYAEGNELFVKREFSRAAAAYARCFEAVPDDAVAKKQLERVDAFIKNPPPDDWDGVFNLTSK